MKGIPWASAHITPLVFGSAYDPPALPVIPDLSPHLRFLGPWFWRPLRQSLSRATRSWASPLDRLRSEIGLPPVTDNPLVDGHSPALVLALFSKLLADRQPDWPPQTIQTGFPFYDRDGEQRTRVAPRAGPVPGRRPAAHRVHARRDGGHGRRAILRDQHRRRAKLGRRAVIVGIPGPNRPAPLPHGVAAFEYAPFSELFPRAAALVHAGGIGTTGLAMRSGRPMLVVPHAHDQPDNAQRLTRLGIARTLFPPRYTSDGVAAELGRLLDDPSYSRRASEVGDAIRQEDGVQAACDALEALL